MTRSSSLLRSCIALCIATLCVTSILPASSDLHNVLIKAQEQHQPSTHQTMAHQQHNIANKLEHHHQPSVQHTTIDQQQTNKEHQHQKHQQTQQTLTTLRDLAHSVQRLLSPEVADKQSTNNNNDVTNSQCFRKQSEFIGTPHANTKHIIIFVIVASVVLALSALCCFAILWRHDSKQAKSSQRQQTLLISHSSQFHTVYERPWYMRCFKAFSIISLICGVILIIVGVLIFPQQPEVSLCDHTMNWPLFATEFILNPQEVNGEMSIQLSLYNSNRLSIELFELQSNIQFQNENIANAKIPHSVHLEAGSVTDLIINVEFTLPTATGLRLLAAHASGSVKVTVDIQVKSSLKLFNHQIMPKITNKISIGEIDLEMINNRKYCKCKE
jgi:LEA14-like dessication related protein